MTPVVTVVTLTTGGTLTVTTNDNGTIFNVVGDTVTADCNFAIVPADSRTLATNLDAAEDARDLEGLIALQAAFETECGAELIAYNSQALTKDPVTRQYTQAVTRLAFDAYQKGLDGPP
ncbi:hypothetical protein D3C80_388040 [compost metagenome]